MIAPRKWACHRTRAQSLMVVCVPITFWQAVKWLSPTALYCAAYRIVSVERKMRRNKAPGSLSLSGRGYVLASFLFSAELFHFFMIVTLSNDAQKQPQTKTLSVNDPNSQTRKRSNFQTPAANRPLKTKTPTHTPPYGWIFPFSDRRVGRRKRGSLRRYRLRDRDRSPSRRFGSRRCCAR